MRIEGHLARSYSPDGAFAPSGSTMAVAESGGMVIANIAEGSVEKVVRPRLENIASLSIQSANFVSPTRLFVLASALIKAKHHRTGSAELGFQWDITQDALFGKILAMKGGFLPPRYLPLIHYLVLAKAGVFELWNPVTGRGGAIQIAALSHPAHLFQFSPNGQWLLLAQIETNASPNPVVVSVPSKQIDNVLVGHEGPVLGMAFSRDGTKVVTACADGKVRVFSVPSWKLLRTLSGNNGPVHWAEFSPNGNWVASAGQDTTVRIWSVATGKLVQTLSESQHPLLTVGFSPDGKYLAATSENTVHVWARTRVD